MGRPPTARKEISRRRAARLRVAASRFCFSGTQGDFQRQENEIALASSRERTNEELRSRPLTRKVLMCAVWRHVSRYVRVLRNSFGAHGLRTRGGDCLYALAMRVLEGLVRPLAGKKKQSRNDKQTFDQKGVPRTRGTWYAGGGVQAVACVCSKLGF